MTAQPAGMVAAGHDATATAAATVLADGGTAFDAIIAAIAMACVAEPVLASLGGGGFLTALPVGERARVHDFFVQTPGRRRPESEMDFRPLRVDFGTVTQEFHVGMATVAVPGLVRGLFDIHSALGRVPMRDLLAPAVRAAREGVAVRAFDAHVLDIVAPIFTHDPTCAAHYASPGADQHAADQHAADSATSPRLLQAGDRFRSPELADALESLGIEGPELFYRGEIAERLAAVTADGGHVGRADLEKYQTACVPALTSPWRDWQLAAPPPPASGGVLIAFALDLLSPVLPGGQTPYDPARLLALVDALSLTSEARARVEAQSGHAPDESILSPAFTRVYRERLANLPRAHSNTSHISIIDGSGNAAAATLSNGSSTGRLVPGTGIMLNNMLGEQDLNRAGFHRWPTDTRMTSMMCPTVARAPDGSLLAIGSGGSNRIRSAVLQVLLNVLDAGLDVASAVAAPRVHLEDSHLSVEHGFDVERLEPVLSRWRDHKVWSQTNMFFGGVHTVIRNARGHTDGSGDPRRGGVCVRA